MPFSIEGNTSLNTDRDISSSCALMILSLLVRRAANIPYPASAGRADVDRIGCEANTHERSRYEKVKVQGVGFKTRYVVKRVECTFCVQALFHERITI